MIRLQRVVMVSDRISEQFQNFIDRGRILLFEAPCGFGKTTLSKELIGRTRMRLLEVRADEADFLEISKNQKWDILFVEELHQLQNEEEYQPLCELIRENPHRRFVLTSRGELPGALIPFRISGLLKEIDEQELFFKKEDAAEYFKRRNIALSDNELNHMMKLTLGYPLALELTADRIEKGESYNQTLNRELLYDLYRYYDEMIFRRFPLSIRRFLLELAPFEEFDTELAKMVSGDAEAGKMIAYLEKNSRMIEKKNADRFSFWALFRNFLMWEQQRSYTPEQQSALFSRGGLYYALHQNYAKALEFYQKSGEQDKVSELIIKVTELHPGMGHYEELEDYYFSLSENVISNSPALMQGMSMLCSLRGDYETSDRWYENLKNFVHTHEQSDASVKEARGRLAWLDISLPHRRINGLVETIQTVFRLVTSKAISLGSFSVTSTLPSIMNGGKDFSEWSKKDDFLYATMRMPVAAVLGKDGIGLPEVSIAESKFEKGEDISGRMLALIPKLGEVQNHGTPDIEFALVGLLVRSQTASGKAEDAENTLENLRGRFLEQGEERFLPNIDAMRCRLALRMGDLNYVEEWYRDRAPRDRLKLKVLRRYQYLTQAMAELSFGDPDAALLTLAPLKNYFEICGRHIDMICLKLLSAIAFYRKEDPVWKTLLGEAVEIAAEYNFTRTVSDLGAAILPLLSGYQSEQHGAFIESATRAARAQAVFYPDFLTPEQTLYEKLTDAEMQVLRLLCADKSNQEIGEILDIQLSTVKSHVSHILQKLGVSRRSQAKTTAQKLRII